ncbi:MAG TPA: hypothetical protein VI455_05775 [Terriglobia bacterium]
MVGFNTIPLSSTAPANGQVYQYSGTQNQWIPATIAFSAAGDLSGSSGSQTVVGLQGRTLASTAPAANQFLAWNASSLQWQPTQPAFSNLSGSAACGQIPSLTGDATTAAGSCNVTVAKLQGQPISNAIPASGQVLTFTSTGWTPSAPSAGNVNCPNLPALTGDATTTVGSCGTTVARLQGRSLTATLPAANQFLGWNNSAQQWQPTQPAFSNLSGSATCGQIPSLTGDATTTAGSCATTVARLQGQNLAATLPAANQFLGWNSSAQQWQPVQPAFSNLSGTAACTQVPNLTGDATTAAGSCNVTVAKLQGQTLSNAIPTSGQVLTFTSTGWTPSAPSAGNVNCPNLPALTGDATTTAGSCGTTVARLQGQSLAATLPAANQVLGWNSSAQQWQPTQPAFSNLSGAIA